MGAVAVVTTLVPGSWKVIIGIGIGTPIEFVGMDTVLDMFS